MAYSLLVFAALSLGQTESLKPGDHKRTITVDERKRFHWIHIPPRYDPKQPAPVVLILHGAMMDAKAMEAFSDLTKTADDHNFVAVYPNGTGPGGFFQTWNSGVFPGPLNNQRPDDVKYLGKVLDDVASVVKVDPKRTYVAGLSNGGMMAYRLASEMPERIAAIASVGGTMVVEKYEPKRPISVLHFHGTKDNLVPFDGPILKKETPAYLKFRSVNDTIMTCVKANGCMAKPKESEIEMKVDKLKVVRKEYGGGKEKTEVVLYVIENGGHTWPGSSFAPALLGPSTLNISANELMWAFFQKHTR